MRFIRQLSWVLRALLFLVIFAFALLNTQTVSLRVFLGQTWEMPMILALLLFFALGAAIGILACVSRMLGQRREIQKLSRALRAGDRAAPPQPRSRRGLEPQLRAVVAVRVRAVLRPGLARGARRHQAIALGVPAPASLVLPRAQLPAERAARQGDRGLHRGGQGRPRDGRAAFRAR